MCGEIIRDVWINPKRVNKLKLNEQRLKSKLTIEEEIRSVLQIRFSIE